MKNHREPSEQLYRNVLAGFTKQGTTLARWCRENNVIFTTARNSIMFDPTRTKRAKELREKACKAAGV